MTPAGTETVFSQDTEGSTGLQTTTKDLSAFDGESVAIEVEKGGNASIVVDDVRLFVDSDAGGLSDNEEREGFRTGFGDTITSNVSEPDTDDDGLDDEPETNPKGVTLDVVNESITVDGTTYTGPHRWDYNGETSGGVTVRTHPLNPDTDGDGRRSRGD